jgi:Zn-dependent M28 family amino/carboxypeptidase
LLKQVSFGPRVPNTKGHDDCGKWIGEQLQAVNSGHVVQAFTHRWSQSGRLLNMANYYATQNWKDATTRVVLIAHWDTRPTADQEYDYRDQKKAIPGANDGASGVAVLLELMRQTKDRLPKELGVMYLMVDGEDVGPGLDEMFLGATHFAKNPGDPKPDYGILLDMIGDKDLVIPMEPQSGYYASPLLKAFYQHAKKIGMGATFPEEWGPTIEDDHIPLNKRGIPTIDLIDFSYPSWHTLADTPDKCSADSLGKVGKTLESWLLKEPVWKYPKRN